MVKKRLLCLPVFIMMCTGTAAYFYSRPASLWNLCPGLSAEACKELQIWYENESDEDDVALTVAPEDPGFDALMALLQGQQFSRKFLRSQLPEETRVHARTEGDYRWQILLRFEDVTLPDGSVGSGTLLRIDDFFGDLTVSFDGTDWRCTAKDQETWRAEVMDCILRTAEEKEG